MPSRPPRRTQLPAFELVVEDQSLASPHLTAKVFEMMKALNQTAECPICMNDVMCCPSGGCMALRVCGHITCLRCHVRSFQESENGDVKCPVCRA